MKALAVGFFAAVLGAFGSWWPSFWYDEAATVYSATRPRADLLRFLDHQDAVHGLYYLGMHYWFGAFGTSEFSARLPSALAVGVAAAGVVVLADLVADGRTALAAGLMFAVLPRITWAAVEARSFAVTAMLAIWLTIVLVLALNRHRSWWVLYAILLSLLTITFVFAGTIVAAHAVTVLSRNWRGRWPWFLGAAIIGGVLALPALRVIGRQSGQVAWIPALDRHVFRALGEHQWFVGAPLFALCALVLIVVLIRRVASDLVAIALPWALVPTALIVAYSFHKPIYLDRYLTFTTGAVALLLGASVAAIGARWWIAAIVLVATAAPAYVSQRGAYAKPSGMDFSAVADFMAEHGKRGDCVLFAGREDWNPNSARVVENIRPRAFDGMQDPGLGRDAVTQGWLWDESRPLADVADQVRSCETVWYIGDSERDAERTIRHTSNEVWELRPYRFEESDDFHRLAALGFVVENRWQFNVSQVVRLRR